jgi:hypothetical protein
MAEAYAPMAEAYAAMAEAYAPMAEAYAPKLFRAVRAPLFLTFTLPSEIFGPKTT